MLILGPTGCGKELAARAIHALSPRREQPLVVVNAGTRRILIPIHIPLPATTTCTITLHRTEPQMADSIQGTKPGPETSNSTRYPNNPSRGANMHLITTEIQSYIRCIKMLWNEYYRHLPDGEHDFADVQRLVWETLVIKLLQDTRVDVSHGEIVLASKKPLVTVLVGSSSQDERAVSWQKATRSLEGQVFLFEQFFDFRNWEDPRELQYVECWSTALPREHLLFETDEVDFYYRVRQPN